jgi:Alpha amylase, catalytic domain
MKESSIYNAGEDVAGHGRSADRVADMPKSIFATEIAQKFAAVREAAVRKKPREVKVNGHHVPVPYPFPSPSDWRDCWIYFLILDRFNNTQFPPKAPWNQRYEYRQGGTFNGVTAQLDYLGELGAKALWLTPVLKNTRPDSQYTYPGYDTQDFLHIDERFGSDGTRETAEKEFEELVAQAHARGIYVIVDTVINHAGQVFDYVYGGGIVEQFQDSRVMDGTVGEPSIQWVNGYGFPRADWQDQIPGVRIYRLTMLSIRLICSKNFFSAAGYNSPRTVTTSQDLRILLEATSLNGDNWWLNTMPDPLGKSAFRRATVQDRFSIS